MSGATLLLIIQRAIFVGTPLLFGAIGEIITEKSGNLNLGIPGIMYTGAISGAVGGFLYQSSVSKVNPALAIIIPLLCAIVGSLLVSLIYCFLTITLRANQNVTGLAITTFGVGCGNLFGGSIIKIINSDAPFFTFVDIAKIYNKPLPIVEYLPQKTPEIFKIILSYGFMVYVALILAVIATLIVKRTRVGLNLRAVGENPATADAAGINVLRYKYVATCVGGVIAGLGGLYYVLGNSNGTWANGAFGDKGWLAIAIVIFATWKPVYAIFGSYFFGALYILFNYLDNIPMTFIPLLKMLPYVATIIVLIVVSLRKKRENQPPASLGLSYFREER